MPSFLKNDLIFATVVSAMLPNASSVRNAWWDVTITFGIEINLESNSSFRICPDLSSKKMSASSSYTSRHAAPIFLALIPSRRASVSISAPLDVFRITMPFFISSIAALLIMCFVSSVSWDGYQAILRLYERNDQICTAWNQSKKRRNFSGLSQRQLSDLSGVPLRTIQQYEQRQKNINKAQAEYLLMLAAALDCEPEHLIERIWISDWILFSDVLNISSVQIIWYIRHLCFCICFCCGHSLHDNPIILFMPLWSGFDLFRENISR